VSQFTEVNSRGVFFMVSVAISVVARYGITIALFVVLCVAPVGIAQEWVRTNGPYGGEVDGLVSRGDTVVYSTIYSYRSTDRGTTWSTEYPGSIAFSAIDSGGVLWGNYALDGTVYFRYGGDGSLRVYRTQLGSLLPVSRDIHPHFIVAPSGTRYAYMDIGNILARCPGREYSTWLAATGEGMPPYFSWFNINARTGVFHMFGYDTVRAKVFHATSTDSGGHWSTRTFDFPDSVSATFGQASLTTDGILFYNAEESIGATYRQELFRSTDDGVTWEVVALGLPGSTVQSIVQADSLTLYGSSYGNRGSVLMISHDGGRSWSELTSRGLAGIPATPRLCFGDSTVIVAADGGGLLRTTDRGANWDVCTEGISWAQATALAVDSVGTVYAVSSTGLYRSTDRGDQWIRCTNGIGGGSFGLAVSARGTVVASRAGVFRSTDHGVSWISSTNGLRNTNPNVLALSSGELIANTLDVQYFSTDDGLNWQESMRSIPSNLPQHSSTAGNGSVAVITTDAGAYCTVDGGRTWSLSTVGLETPFLNFATVAEDNTVYATAGDSTIFRSDDSCRSWHACEGTPYPGGWKGYTTIKYIWGVGLLVSMINQFDSMIYISRDRGRTWQSFVEGFAVRYNTANRFASDGKTLYAATLASVWRRDIVTSVSASAPIASTIGLDIRPNPIVNSGTVALRLAAGSDVDVQLIDLLGRSVATLAHGHRAAGKYSLAINGNEIPAGVYFCRVITPNAMLHASVTILK
jgi:photosystem II stability/assembly factor-like uncharacterized protein